MTIKASVIADGDLDEPFAKAAVMRAIKADDAFSVLFNVYQKLFDMIDEQGMEELRPVLQLLCHQMDEHGIDLQELYF